MRKSRIKVSKVSYVSALFILVGIMIACGAAATQAPPAPASTTAPAPSAPGAPDTSGTSAAPSAAAETRSEAAPTTAPASGPSGSAPASSPPASFGSSQPAPTAVPAVAPAPQEAMEATGTLNVGMTDLGPFVGILQNMPFLHARFEFYITHEPMWATSPDGERLPRLVESWEANANADEFTFNLEREAQFHEGYGGFTADDFIFTIENVIEEGSVHTSAGGIRRVFGCDGCELSKIDDHTVQLKRPKPTYEVTWYSQGPAPLCPSTASPISTRWAPSRLTWIPSEPAPGS